MSTVSNSVEQCRTVSTVSTVSTASTGSTVSTVSTVIARCYLHLRWYFLFTFDLSCCSNCTATCLSCPLGKPDPNQLVTAILGLGGETYK